MALPTLQKKSTMKTMKSMRVSKVAQGRLAKSLVFKGRKEKTTGGLKRESLMKNRRGKIVSKRASAHGKRMYANVESWTEAFMEARQTLRTTGFVAINGKSVFGKTLYVKTKAIQLQHRRTDLSSNAAPLAPTAVLQPEALHDSLNMPPETLSS